MTLLPPEAFVDAVAARYAQVAARLSVHLSAWMGERLPGGAPNVRIAHVGASSIPGALSKGDLDVLLLVPAHHHAAVVSHLLAVGYQAQAGTLRTPQLCMLNGHDAGGPHAVQVVEAGSRFEQVFAGFRDLLCASPALVARYNSVKIGACGQAAAAYRQAKSDFIARVLAEAGVFSA